MPLRLQPLVTEQRQALRRSRALGTLSTRAQRGGAAWLSSGGAFLAASSDGGGAGAGQCVVLYYIVVARNETEKTQCSAVLVPHVQITHIFKENTSSFAKTTSSEDKT